MPNGRPGDSRTHDVVHHGREVFGPACDGLIREIFPRLPPARLAEFHALVEGWPFAPDGSPEDPDGLFHRLAAFRDSLAAPPPPPRASVPATGAPMPAEVPVKRPVRATLGLVLGGTLGVALGFVAYLVLREAVLPTSLWSSDAVMWLVVAAVAAPCAWAGLQQGAVPSRTGHAVMMGLVGFVIGGGMLSALGGILAFALMGDQPSGDASMGFSIGVVFVLMPVVALVGGAVLAGWMARRAWRRWSG